MSSQFSAVCHLTCMPNVYLGHLLPYLLVFWFVIAVQCCLSSLPEGALYLTAWWSTWQLWLVCYVGSTSLALDICHWFVTWVQRHLPKTLVTGLSRGFNVICPRHLWLACHVGSTSSVQDTCDWLVTWIQRHFPQTPMTGLSRGFNVICGHLVSSDFLHFIVFAVSSSRLTVVGVCYFIFQAHCRKVFAVSSSGPTVVRCLLLHFPGLLSSGVCYFIFRDHCRQVFAVSSSGLTVVRCLLIYLLGSLSSGVRRFIFRAHCRSCSYSTYTIH